MKINTTLYNINNINILCIIKILLAKCFKIKLYPYYLFYHENFSLIIIILEQTNEFLDLK